MEIPALWSPAERVARIRAELEDATKPRPTTRKTLENKIQSAFEKNAEPEFVEKIIQSFLKAGILEITENDKISYKHA